MTHSRKLTPNRAGRPYPFFTVCTTGTRPNSKDRVDCTTFSDAETMAKTRSRDTLCPQDIFFSGRLVASVGSPSMAGHILTDMTVFGNALLERVRHNADRKVMP
ncbi:hypothetical protein A0U94_06485 [Gluconobacter albidus]|uniref:hypothetical protein n=1 Tax=Gluconobacter albidus TaxID=318683 RepID=UPI00098B363F|nr:hypothetical protein [Gluconobacter albidus]AQS90671.1 hypothetical protein A0U94_06485 [Gluconobacter albidus]